MINLPTLHGILVRRPAPAAQFAQFIGATTVVNSNPAATSWPAGTTTGDMAMIWVSFLGFGTIPQTKQPALSSWNETQIEHPDNGYYGGFYWKKLASGDISSPPSVSNGSGVGVHTLVYRGPQSCIVRATVQTATGTTLPFGSVATGANYMGLVTMDSDRDVSGDHIPSSGFTERSEVAGSFFRSMTSDLLTTYSGSSITVTGFGSAYNNVGFVVELSGV